jgi:ubiquinone/menaquinone biosynthesis C-methylase UbiE
MREALIHTEARRPFLPAAGHDWFLPFYDVITRLMGADAAKAPLVEQAEIMPGHRVLDVGCGTGSLAIQLKQRFPETEIVGLDPDPKALGRARRKSQRAGVTVQLERGYADALDFPDRFFDRVFSSFMFHHLEKNAKQHALQEICRVLKPGGSLHLLDFTGPESAPGIVSRWFHSNHRLQENSEGRILTLMDHAGLADAKVVKRSAILLGVVQVAYYRASAPEGAILWHRD